LDPQGIKASFSNWDEFSDSDNEKDDRDLITWIVPEVPGFTSVRVLTTYFGPVNE
jgi:hypothetical protein